jgi:hypothetical protein
MATRIITALRTLFYWKGQSILDFMPIVMKAKKEHQTMQEKTTQDLLPKESCGKKRKRQRTFTVNTQLRFGGMTESQWRKNVPCVELNSLPGIINNQRGFAQMFVSQDSVDCPALIMSSGYARVAAVNFLSTNTANRNIAPGSVQVIDIEKMTDLQDVYNLEVETDHEFFANGVLVHNCGDALRYPICWLTRDVEVMQVSRDQIMQIGRY